MNASGLYSTAVSLANSGYNCSSAIISNSTAKVALFVKTIPSYCGKHSYKIGAGVVFAMLTGTLCYKAFGASLKQLVFNGKDKKESIPPINSSLRSTLTRLESGSEEDRKLAERVMDCLRDHPTKLDISGLSLGYTPEVLLELEGVTDLNLSNNSFDHLFLDNFKDFIGQVVNLDLSRNEIESCFFNSDWSSLRSLDLSENRDFCFCWEDGEMPNLRKLNLAGCQGVGVSEMEDLLRLSPLCEVILDETPLVRELTEIRFTDSSYRNIGTLLPKFIERYFLGLKKIDFSGCGVHITELQTKGRLPEWLSKFSNLESLNFSHNDFSDYDCYDSLFRKLNDFPELKYLDLSHTDLGIISSSFFDSHKELRELSLKGNPQLKKLPANVRDLRNLQVLDLQGCGNALLINDLLTKELFDLPASCVIKFDASMKSEVEAFIRSNGIENSPVIWYIS